MSSWFRPVQFTIGDDCLTCHALDETPLHYYVQFQGIEKGDNWNPIDGQPPNRLYDLTQDGDFPCLWHYSVIGGERIGYKMDPAITILTNTFRFPLFAFVSNPAVICRRFHFNNLNVPAGNHFYGGFAMVFTPAEMQAIIEMHTPVVDPDPLLKVSPMAGGLIVVSYIDSWGDTKFKLKFDTTV